MKRPRCPAAQHSSKVIGEGQPLSYRKHSGLLAGMVHNRSHIARREDLGMRGGLKSVINQNKPGVIHC